MPEQVDDLGPGDDAAQHPVRVVVEAARGTSSRALPACVGSPSASGQLWRQVTARIMANHRGMRFRILPLTSAIIAATFAFQPTVTAAETPGLAGVTYISGSRAGAVEVHLGRKAHIANPLLSQGSVRVTGAGKGFAGFALVATDVPEREGFVLLGGKLPRSAGGRSFLDIGGDWFSIGTSKRYALDPGDYTLYLLPGKGETVVRLELDELQGETTLTPTRSTAYRSDVSANASGLPTENYQYTSSTGKLDGKGLVFASTWFTADAHAVTDTDICFWRNDPRDPDSRLPNCGSTLMTDPGNLWGSSGTISYGPSTEDVFKLFTGSWHPFSSGFDKPGLRYGTSTTIETVVPPHNVGALSFWLTY